MPEFKAGFIDSHHRLTLQGGYPSIVIAKEKQKVTCREERQQLKQPPSVLLDGWLGGWMECTEVPKDEPVEWSLSGTNTPALWPESQSQ